MKKKNVISPLFTHSRRSSEMPCPPISIETVVPHKESYDDESTFTQASAASVAPSKTAAPPVSVRRNSRSGVCTLRAHAVRPENPGAWLAPATSDMTPRSWQRWRLRSTSRRDQGDFGDVFRALLAGAVSDHGEPPWHRVIRFPKNRISVALLDV